MATFGEIVEGMEQNAVLIKFGERCRATEARDKYGDVWDHEAVKSIALRPYCNYSIALVDPESGDPLMQCLVVLIGPPEARISDKVCDLLVERAREACTDIWEEIYSRTIEAHERFEEILKDAYRNRQITAMQWRYNDLCLQIPMETKEHRIGLRCNPEPIRGGHV